MLKQVPWVWQKYYLVILFTSDREDTEKVILKINQFKGNSEMSPYLSHRIGNMHSDWGQCNNSCFTAYGKQINQKHKMYKPEKETNPC